MSIHLIEKFLNDLEAVRNTAFEAAMKVSRDFSDEDLDEITFSAYQKAWETKTNYLGVPKPHEWFLEIAKKKASNLQKTGNNSKGEARQAKASGSPLDDEYLRIVLKSRSDNETYDEAYKYLNNSGLFQEEERLISMADGITGKKSFILERELSQIIETTCYLYSAYLKASRSSQKGKNPAEEKDKYLDRMRFFNERKHSIPETFINALTNDWDAIKLMVALYPRWLYSDFDDKGDFHIIRKHIFYRLHGLVTKSGHWGDKLGKEIFNNQRKTFEELYSSNYNHNVPPNVLQFLVKSFQRLYKAAIDIPEDLKDQIPIPASIDKIMIAMSQGDRIDLKPAAWGDPQRIVTEEMWKIYAKNQPSRYGGNHTAESMAYYMTSKITGISGNTIKRRIRSVKKS